jgi:hypothetical protein
VIVLVSIGAILRGLRRAFEVNFEAIAPADGVKATPGRTEGEAEDSR